MPKDGENTAKKCAATETQRVRITCLRANSGLRWCERSRKLQVARVQDRMIYQLNISRREVIQHLTECTEHVWRYGKPVNGQTTGQTQSLSRYQKWNLTQCITHRTIALVSHASESLLRIILERTRAKTVAEIAVEQAGFRRGGEIQGTRSNLR